MKEKIAIRGLARLASWIFIVWGGLLVLKGLYDCFGGEPEANYFSLERWQFVTREQWMRWSGFELAYGLACLGAALACRRFEPRLPEWIEREKTVEDPL